MRVWVPHDGWGKGEAAVHFFATPVTERRLVCAWQTGRPRSQMAQMNPFNHGPGPQIKSQMGAAVRVPPELISPILSLNEADLLTRVRFAR